MEKQKINEVLYQTATEVANCAAQFIELLNAFRQVTTLIAESTGSNQPTKQEEAFLVSEKAAMNKPGTAYFRRKALVKGYVKIAIKGLMRKGQRPPFFNTDMVRTMSKEIGLAMATASKTMTRAEKDGLIKRYWEGRNMMVTLSQELEDELKLNNECDTDYDPVEPDFGTDKEIEEPGNVKVDETQLP